MNEAVQRLREEARRANERRLLVLTGHREACYAATESALDAAGITDAVVVGGRDVAGTSNNTTLDRVPPNRTADLLGTTREGVVLDCHDETRPNAIGRSVGVVDGGGLFVLLAPPLDEWPCRPDGFDDGLAVPPYGVDDVTGRFRQRIVSLLRQHPGVAVVDAENGTVERDGLTGASTASDRDAPQRDAPQRDAPQRDAPQRDAPSPPPDHAFPAEAYDRCLTDGQVSAVRAFETLRVTESDPDAESEPHGDGRAPAVVVESDRGRGKSSAAGLAAGALAAAGRDVLVTAPVARGTDELFARARELLDALDEPPGDDSDDSNEPDDPHDDRDLRTRADGRIRFASPVEEAGLPDAPDAVFVDEAAGISVDLLDDLLGRVPVGYTTTVHGYEGAGRGFSVRFRERLDAHAAAGGTVLERELREPIRYAGGDPVESWAFRALALDARPAVDAAVDDAAIDSVAYERPSADDLLDDEHRLREAFGLLVLAHYRTEPDDLARLLDAPNLSARTLTHDGRVVAVALLAREGGLTDDQQAQAYEGGRIRGNMLPDLLSGQLRDPDAARPVGVRTVRIAVHPAVRSRGLGSQLLDRIHDEFAADVDWFGTGYGATPRLLRFWRANGYRVVHLSATRNESSGEHSAAMLRPAGANTPDCADLPDGADTPDGDCPLCDRHGRWFRDRVGDCLLDTLRDLDPDVVRAALAATDHASASHASPGHASTGHRPPDLDDREWRIVVSAAYGPGQLDPYPGPFRRLVLAWLTDPDAAMAAAGSNSGDDRLNADDERLLVRRVLQGWSWESAAADLELHSASAARKAVGRALRPLVDRYGTDAARSERSRYDQAYDGGRDA